MIKIAILIILVAFSIQNRNDRRGHKEHDKDDHIECNDYDQSQCEGNVGCIWSYDSKETGCYPAIYTDLGNKRTIEQQVTFDQDANCDNVIEEKDFVARQTFHHRFFRSFCNFWNIEQIFVNNRFFWEEDSLDVQEIGRYAIIYPKVPEGTAYLYSRKFFRGDSWLAKGPTKLNGQVVRSIAVGINTRLSLYDHQGEPVALYQGVKRTLETLDNGDKIYRGIEDVKDADDVEFVLVETYLGA